MRKRSCLYSLRRDDNQNISKIFDISEMEYDLPLVDKILVSSNTKIVDSLLFDNAYALQGNAKEGRERLEQFLLKVKEENIGGFYKEDLKFRVQSLLEYLDMFTLDYFLLEPHELFSIDWFTPTNIVNLKNEIDNYEQMLSNFILDIGSDADWSELGLSIRKSTLPLSKKEDVVEVYKNRETLSPKVRDVFNKLVKPCHKIVYRDCTPRLLDVAQEDYFKTSCKLEGYIDYEGEVYDKGIAFQFYNIPELKFNIPQEIKKVTVYFDFSTWKATIEHSDDMSDYISIDNFCSPVMNFEPSYNLPCSVALELLHKEEYRIIMGEIERLYPQKNDFEVYNKWVETFLGHDIDIYDEFVGGNVNESFGSLYDIEGLTFIMQLTFNWADGTVHYLFYDEENKEFILK